LKLKTNAEMITAFNAISLTDIIFLLLIFFLLSSTFILQPGVKVELPRTTSTDVSSEKSIVITIDASGTVYLSLPGKGDHIVSRDVLGAELRKAFIDVGKPIVIIRPDKRIPVDTLIGVMDVARSAGGDKFVIATRKIEM